MARGRLKPFMRACLGTAAWFLSGCFSARIGFAVDALRVAIDGTRWDPQWPLIPWLLVVASLGLAALRRPPPTAPGQSPADLARRVSTVGTTFLCLAGLRWLSLWTPLGYLFPWLGLLWSPHMTWALAISTALVLLPAFFAEVTHRRRHHGPRRSVAISLFAVFTTLYGSYGLYYSQLTLLHGDEGQYLRVSQSLVHDGDLDLANNLAGGFTHEFHAIEFPMHLAAASPPGTSYSRHPAGLSILLTPAYWLGLKLWEYPRLACALFMSVLAAGCVSLAYLWLGRLGHPGHVALICAVAMGSTAPVGLFSNQLYPDIPALLILLVGLNLMYRWQASGREPSDLGPREPWVLGLLALLTWFLLLLHPRLLPLAVIIAAFIALQLWQSSRRASWASVLVCSAIGLSCVLWYNLTFSGDLLGNFHSSNLWEGNQEILSLAVLLPNLAGLWIEGSQGLLPTSPFYLLAPVGLALMARHSRDRRLVLAICILGATAGVSALNLHWMIGYCIAGRYLIAAMPAVLLGLAHIMPALLRHPALALPFSLGLAVSWDSLAASFPMPETSIAGKQLALRAVEGYYPTRVHFPAAGSSQLSGPDVLFWGLLALGAFAAVELLNQRRAVAAALVIAATALLPAAAARTETVRGRLPIAVSRYTAPLAADGSARDAYLREVFHLNDVRPHTTGAILPDGRLRARDGDGGGFLSIRDLPYLRPGRLTFRIPGLEVAGRRDHILGHVIATHRRSVVARSPWEVRRSWTLMPSDSSPSYERQLTILELGQGTLSVEYAGTGEIGVNPGMVAACDRFEPRYREIQREKLTDQQERGDSEMAFQSPDLALDAGLYRASFELEGSAISSMFEANPASVALAVYARPVATERQRPVPGLDWQSSLWLQLPRAPISTVQHNQFERPLVERVQAPWWTSLGFLGGKPYDLTFQVPEASTVRLLAKYHGSHSLRLAGVTVLQLVGAGEARDP